MNVNKSARPYINNLRTKINQVKVIESRNFHENGLHYIQSEVDSDFKLQLRL